MHAKTHRHATAGHHIIGSLFLVASLLAGCGGGGDIPLVGNPAPTPPPPATGSQPSATAVGTPNGAAASATIGAAGGTLSAPDGALTLTIPAGALASNTVIGIQPLSNNAHGRRGVAYRLTPDGQTFAQPIELKFTYTDQDLQGTAIEALGAAFQRADGMWQWAGAPTVDAAAKTLKVTSTHFSDWSKVGGLQIRPGSKTVKLKANLDLRVAYCFSPDEGELVRLAYNCDEGDGFLSVSNPVSDWSVNGVAGGGASTGTVSSSADPSRATYTAPATCPSPLTVAVSARVAKSNQSPGTTLLVSNITIEECAAPIPPPPAAWKGTASSSSPLTSTTAEVTWTFERTENNVSYYRPTGTIVSILSGDCSWSPTNSVIETEDGVLVVDYNTTPPTYSGGASSGWPAVITCQGASVDGFASGIFFGGSKADDTAAGAVSADGTTIEGSGSFVEPPTTVNWKFTRN